MRLISSRLQLDREAGVRSVRTSPVCWLVDMRLFVLVLDIIYTCTPLSIYPQYPACHTRHMAPLVCSSGCLQELEMRDERLGTQ